MIEEFYIWIDGLPPSFSTGNVYGDYPNAITSISTLASTLDPTEPIVDSSPFTVELAADAVNQYDRAERLRDVFSRDPVHIGNLTRNFMPGDQYIYFTAEEEIYDNVCIGPCRYYVEASDWSGNELQCEVGGFEQQSPHYVDTVLGIAPEVTYWPRVWKGRFAFLYRDGHLYRTCYLTENPRFTANSVILTMAPLDARIRDHHVAALTPTVGHFAPKGRDYILGTKKTKHLFFWSTKQSPVYTVGTISNTNQIALVSGTHAYTGLYNTIQAKTSTAAGGPILPALQTAHRIFTPCSPSIGKTLGGVSRWGIVGRSSATIVFDQSFTTDSPFSFYCDPSLRVLVGDGSGTGCNQLSTRFSSATYSDPLVAVAVGSPNDAPTVLARAYARTSYDYGPTLCIGFIWRQNEKDSTRVEIGPKAESASFADNLIEQWAGGYRCCASCADSEAGIDDLMDTCDVYSLKPVSPPDAEIAKSRLLLGAVTPVTERAAGYELAPNAAITLAQATLYWCAGESNICLDKQFGEAGNTVWFDVKWTEDGNEFIERRIDLIYRDEPATGIYRYDIGADLAFKLRYMNWIAGIGDWFGNRAAFTADTTIAAPTDSALLWDYFTSNKFGGCLWIPSWYLDRASFNATATSLNLISRWQFEDAKTLDDNIGAMLALGSTAITFNLETNYTYQIARQWIGPLRKDEQAQAINEDQLLEIPTAELEDHIIGDYSISFADDKTVTYSDVVAKSLFNAEKKYELDLSSCPLNVAMSPSALADAMRGTLASLVNRFGAETMCYRLKIPFYHGKNIAPGDAISLTCSRVVGASVSAPPAALGCRVLDVEQDIMGQTTSLRVVADATNKRVAKYQRGCRVLSGFTTKNVTVDDASWITAGQTLYYGNNVSLSVVSKAGNDLELSIALPYTCTLWGGYNSARFNNSTDQFG